MDEAQRDFILQQDWRNSIIGKLGREAWITVYEIESSETETIGKFSGLIPQSLIEECLKDTSWDISIGHVRPSLITYEQDGQMHSEYVHFRDEDQIEPLVLIRNFHGIRPEGIEIQEEFRLYHNLDYDHGKFAYIKVADNGTEEEVVRVRGKQVQIRLGELIDYLAARQMCLGIYFQVVRWSILEITAIEPSSRVHSFANGLMRYSFIVDDNQGGKPGYNTMSVMTGKKLLPPLPFEESSINKDDELVKEYESFIVAVDETGKPVFHTSNIKNENAGSEFGYLTRVFFRREVLGKYYSDPDRYVVDNGYLRCGGLWSIQIGNNDLRYVAVYLGDLGELPDTEQKHWRSFNVLPDGEMSETDFRRTISAEFTEPTEPALYFKSRFQDFVMRWKRELKYDLFRPLDETEGHRLKTLRVPLTDTSAEFDEQVLSLAHILIESLNDAELAKQIIGEIPPNTKSIGKLELLLRQKQSKNVDEIIGFLRKLQDLRSKTSAHRRGTSYPKEMAKLEVDLNNKIGSIMRLLEEASDTLRFLAEDFLDEKS